MNKKINTIRPIDLTQYNSNIMIPKDRLPKRHFDIKHNPNEKFEVVAINRDGNKADIQEMAKLLTQSKSENTQKANSNYTKNILLKGNPYLPVASFWGIENWQC